MIAYANGKKVERYSEDLNKWVEVNGPIFNWSGSNYRIIKQEPTYRPFKDKEECWTEMQKHSPFGWVSYGNRFINILNIDDIGVDFLYDGDLDSLDYLANSMRLKFVDGTPFGVLEE